MQTSIEIQNLKYGGCCNTITNKLNTLDDVSNVLVDVENSTLSFDYTTKAVFDAVNRTLAKSGYPLVDEKNTLGRKTKSYISCAMGRMGN